MAEETLYEVLKVKPDASVEEIKRAYLMYSKIHHPDKGGNPEDFDRLAKAYKVLIDPGSRLLYDATGRTEAININREAQDILVQGFQNAIHSVADDIVKFVFDFIKDGENQLNEAKMTNLDIKRHLIEKRTSVRHSSPKHMNLFEMVIDGELRKIQGALSVIEEKLSVAGKCYELLQEYQSPQPKIKIYSHTFGQGRMTTTVEHFPSVEDLIQEALKRSMNKGAKD